MASAIGRRTLFSATDVVAQPARATAPRAPTAGNLLGSVDDLGQSTLES